MIVTLESKTSEGSSVPEYNWREQNAKFKEKMDKFVFVEIPNNTDAD
jgi:hypothetical protein